MLTDARFKFALESLKKCMLMEPKNNIFFSPHLLYQNLLVLYFGAIDDTEDSLRRILYIPDDISKAVLQQHYHLSGGASQFCYVLNGPKNFYTCRIFSRLFIDDDKVLYVDTMNLFSSGHQVKEYHFDTRPDLARNFINNTVKCITQKYIQDILPADSIDSKTEAILLNIIYYKFEQLNAYIMEVPFKEKEISTFFIFPSCHVEPGKYNFSERDGIIQLIERLMTKEGSQELHKLLDDGITQETEMLFPTFNIEQDLEIHPLLDMLGIQEFTPSGTGLLHEFTSNTLRLGDAVHRVRIEMTKTSITAAATNIFLTNNNSCQHVEKQNTVDMHFPCVCLIYDRSRRNILFCGVLLES